MIMHDGTEKVGNIYLQSQNRRLRSLSIGANEDSILIFSIIELLLIFSNFLVHNDYLVCHRLRFG